MVMLVLLIEDLKSKLGIGVPARIRSRRFGLRSSTGLERIQMLPRSRFSIDFVVTTLDSSRTGNYVHCSEG